LRVISHNPLDITDKLAAKTSDGFERVVDQLWDIINPALIIQNKSIEPFENQQLRNTVPTASYQSDKLNLDDTQKKLLRVLDQQNLTYRKLVSPI